MKKEKEDQGDQSPLMDGDTWVRLDCLFNKSCFYSNNNLSHQSRRRVSGHQHEADIMCIWDDDYSWNLLHTITPYEHDATSSGQEQLVSHPQNDTCILWIVINRSDNGESHLK